jgi:hypothetical protein
MLPGYYPLLTYLLNYFLTFSLSYFPICSLACMPTKPLNALYG